jgi:transcription elongation GreA/GreB family factor|tara:strand:+ start:369 stop:914 length:546 start_codon:yes stop_codon:yes gene_type:complete
MKTMITNFNIDNSTKYTVKSRGVNMTEGNFMTEKSRQRIMAEIRSLEATRPEITDRIGAARLQGGLEENEELLMALEDMQRLEQSLGRQTDNLVDAQIIQPISLGKKKNVAVGTTVTIVNIDTDQEHIYTVLGVHDSDPTNGIISYKSPMGAELLTREVDDEIEVNGTYYEITKIVAKKQQ